MYVLSTTLVAAFCLLGPYSIIWVILYGSSSSFSALNCKTATFRTPLQDKLTQTKTSLSVLAAWGALSPSTHRAAASTAPWLQRSHQRYLNSSKRAECIYTEPARWTVNKHVKSEVYGLHFDDKMNGICFYLRFPSFLLQVLWENLYD